MGSKSRARKSVIENRGIFKHETTTSESEWVVRAMRRGGLAFVIFGAIAFLAGGLPYTLIVGLLFAAMALGMGWWMFLDKLFPFEGGDSVKEFNKHMEESPWPSASET